ncbi:hypothetical protein JCM8208_000548 [Rhodotorula glutinis]
MEPSLLAVETLVLAVLIAAASVLALALVAHSGIFKHPRALGTRPRPDLWSSPVELPLLGCLVDSIRNIDRVVQRFIERQHSGETDKSITFTLPAMGRFILLERPEHLEHIQRTRFDNYEKGEAQRSTLGTLFGSGIFVSDGAAWQTHRKISAKLFTNSTYRGIISTSTHRSTAQLLDVIDRLSAHGEVPLSQLFFALTLDAFTFMAFSTDPGALLAAKDGKLSGFGVALDYVQVETQKRFQNPFWFITERLTGTTAKMRSSMRIVHDFADAIIDARLAPFDQKGDEGQDGQDDLLALYMRSRGIDGEKLSKIQLRDAVINLLLAGRDTTASALSWAVFRILSRLDLVHRIRAEAGLLSDPNELPFDQLKDMHWTRAIFEETVRLHPAVPNNSWTALGDDLIPNGPRIEKGDHVGWCDFLQARDPSIWGDDAGEFKPERWLDDEGKFRMDSRLHAFNGGFRRCLGETLATFESVAVLLALFSTFDLAFAPDYLATTPMVQTPLCAEPTPRCRHALTMPMAQVLTVVATRRER